jgi:CRP-like cAMP-binding protein
MKPFLKSVEIFRELGEAELDLLVPLLKHETFKKGEAIFREREPGGKLYLVEAGVVELSKSRPDGRPARVSLLERGEVLGELSMADDGPRSVTATAAVSPETRLVSIEVPALQAVLAQNAAMAAKVQRSLLRRLSHRLRATSDAVHCLLRAMEPG